MLKNISIFFFIFFLFSGCTRTVYIEVPVTVPGTPSATSGLTFSVPSTFSTGVNQWFDTGIEVKEGQLISVTAKGEWRLGGGPRLCNANGLPNFPPYNGHLYGTLMAKIGQQGPSFAVGTNFEGEINSAGRLFLGNNDINNSDNSGALSVTIDTK